MVKAVVKKVTIFPLDVLSNLRPLGYSTGLSLFLGLWLGLGQNLAQADDLIQGLTPNTTPATPEQLSPPPASPTPSSQSNPGDSPSLGDPDAYLPAPEPFVSRLVIRLGERRVYVYHQDNVLDSYPIAVGKAGWETPTGSFQVLQMIQNPAWQHPWNGSVIPPGPDNPLGDRWIGFWTDGTNSIGFHGTPTEELVGQAVSHGCIRMLNHDVRALFELVEPGTPVMVEP